MHPWDRDHWLPGVLSKEQLKQLIDESYILGVRDFKDAADYSSINLYLSDEGYQMLQGSIKPCGSSYRTFLNDDRFAQRLGKDDGCFQLKHSECYVFKLRESLAPKLSGSNIIYGQATAKSSIGRVDVIARLIVDGMFQYESMRPDDLKEHSSGEMFIEIIPISFNVRVKEGISLSQLRLFYGKPEDSEINDDSFIKGILLGSEDGKGFLSVDIRNTTIGGLEVVAFGAITSDIEDDYIDLWKKEPPDSRPDPCKYWCFLRVDETGRLKIKKDQFYLIRSKERISLPSGVAVYCRPMDETLGEMRIHYAGFAHPFFGMKREDDKSGTPLIFEVRGHNVDVNLEDGEKLAKLIFYRMSKVAEEETEKKTGYGNQELSLSGIFDEWPERLRLIDEKKGRVEKY
jgi:dCTP deaminase